MNDARNELLAEYRAAIYEVRTPGGRRAALRIGEPLPSPLRQWLADGHEFAFITAHNPHSQICSATENRRRQRELHQQLRAHGCRVLAGVSRAHDGHWREASLFVAAIDATHLDRLARQFRQNAVLAGRNDGTVDLRLCRDDWPACITGA